LLDNRRLLNNGWLLHNNGLCDDCWLLYHLSAEQRPFLNTQDETMNPPPIHRQHHLQNPARNYIRRDPTSRHGKAAEAPNKGHKGRAMPTRRQTP